MNECVANNRFQIDFAGMQIRSVAEQRRAADENRRKEAFERQKIDAALSEMAGDASNVYKVHFPFFLLKSHKNSIVCIFVSRCYTLLIHTCIFRNEDGNGIVCDVSKQLFCSSSP